MFLVSSTQGVCMCVYYALGDSRLTQRRAGLCRHHCSYIINEEAAATEKLAASGFQA